MTWGPYWMFYKCDKCQRKFKSSFEDIHLRDFGKCPTCKEDAQLVGETKDKPADAQDYEEVLL